MKTNALVTVPRFIRTDRSDGASEILTIVRLTSGKFADSLFACSDLDGREYPYLVEICTGPVIGDDFVGLYDLDGERIYPGNADWERVAEAPAEVVDQIENGWESGSNLVTRLVQP